MTQVYLIRHGVYVEDDSDTSRAPMLSPDGIRQAERLRDRLLATGEIEAKAIVTSTLKRARETADILAAGLGLPVTPEPDLEEWRSENALVT